MGKSTRYTIAFLVLVVILIIVFQVEQKMLLERVSLHRVSGNKVVSQLYKYKELRGRFPASLQGLSEISDDGTIGVEIVDMDEWQFISHPDDFLLRRTISGIFDQRVLTYYSTETRWVESDS